MHPLRHRPSPHGFTLIELLVVLAIIGILGTLTVPALFKMMRGSNLTVGSNHLVDQLNLSRQQAMAKNCKVEVRFYELPDPTVSGSITPAIYRAFQSFSLDGGGSQTNALTKVIFMPDQVYATANATASTLLQTTVYPGTAPLGTLPASSYQYQAFHFNADGSTDLTATFSSPWFISLANQHDKAQDASTGLPANYITVQIDAQTGRVRYFRPN